MRNEERVAYRREEWIDCLKGVLIFLVVLGHLIASEVNGELNIFGVVHYLIYAVHMPMFVLISGYFSKTEYSIWKVIRNYIVPYVVFDFIYAMFGVIRGGSIGNLNVLVPYYVYWYILCIGLMKLILLFSRGRWEAAVILTIVSILTPFVSESAWRILSLGRVCLLYGIFYVGYLLRQHMDQIQRHAILLVIFGCGGILLELILLLSGVVGVDWATHDYADSVTEVFLKWIYMFIVVIGLFLLSAVGSKKLTYNYKNETMMAGIHNNMIGGGWHNVEEIQ